MKAIAQEITEKKEKNEAEKLIVIKATFCVGNMADNMADVEKNNMKETYKSRSLPTQLQVIPKPILQKLQDDTDNHSSS